MHNHEVDGALDRQKLSNNVKKEAVEKFGWIGEQTVVETLRLFKKQFLFCTS